MRTTKTMTVSLPPGIMEIVETMKRREHRTNSELVREALREYFYGQFPVYKPTPAELRAINAGREEIRKGNYVTWEELRAELDSKSRSKSKKSARVATR